MTYAGYSAYNRISTTLDSKEMILVKLLDGAVRFLKAARSGLAAGNSKTKGENISKAIAIIAELDKALDRGQGGNLAINLSKLYPYMLFRLTDGNFRNDDRLLEEVEGLLLNLKEGFREAFRQMSVEVVSDHAQSCSSTSQKGFCVDV